MMQIHSKPKVNFWFPALFLYAATAFCNITSFGQAPNTRHHAYIGIGAKAFLHDETMLVLNARYAPIPYVSLREDVGLNRHYTLSVSSITAELPVWKRFALYGGPAATYGNDGYQHFLPTAVAGLDVYLPLRLVVRLGGMVVFRKGDTDSGALATVNFAF